MSYRFRRVVMEREIKFGISATAICGFIMAPLGLFFCIMGVFMYFVFKQHPENLDGDPIIFLFTFLGVGTSLLIVGCILLYIELKKRSKIREAVEHGQYVVAEFISVSRKTNVRINNHNPYVADFGWFDQYRGEMHIFHSRPLLYDPTQMLVGKSVRVFLHPSDPSAYYVDIDEAMPRVTIH